MFPRLPLSLRQLSFASLLLMKTTDTLGGDVTTRTNDVARNHIPRDLQNQLEMQSYCVFQEDEDGSCWHDPYDINNSYECKDRPWEMTLVYRGGDCDAEPSSTVAMNCDGGFNAEVSQSEVYIVVKELGSSTIYFEGYVGLDNPFRLYNDYNDFADELVVVIYKDEETKSSNSEDHFQLLTFNTTCAHSNNNPIDSTLLLGDRLGALEVAGWRNSNQGLVSLYNKLGIDVFPLVDMTVESLYVDFKVADLEGGTVDKQLNFTNLVHGRVVPHNDFFSELITIPINSADTGLRTLPLKVTFKGRSTVTDEQLTVKHAVSIADHTSEDIYASESSASKSPSLLSSETEAPDNEYDNTGAPSENYDTVAPSSLVPNKEPCNLQASIQCTTKTGLDCDDLPIAQSGLVCGIPSTDNIINLQSLAFVYTGKSCGMMSPECEDIMEVGLRPETVWIKIMSSSLSIQKLVRVGDMVEITHEITGDDWFFIVVEAVGDNGRPGDLIQAISGLQFICSSYVEGGLVLGQQIGGLQVVSFENIFDGYQSLRQTLELIYVIKNVGASDTKVLKAFGTPYQEATTGLLLEKHSEDAILRPGEELRLSGRTVEIDTSKYAIPEISFSIEGQNLDIGGTICFDSAFVQLPKL